MCLIDEEEMGDMSERDDEEREIEPKHVLATNGGGNFSAKQSLETIEEQSMPSTSPQGPMKHGLSPYNYKLSGESVTSIK
jgi:hypothetical protein